MTKKEADELKAEIRPEPKPIQVRYATIAKGERHNAGKLRWALICWRTLEGLVRVLMFGAKKYSDHNWKKGLPTTEIADSLMRHLTAYLNGENIDPESGLPHVDHIQCNAMFLAHMAKFRPDCDTRFSYTQSTPEESNK